MLIFAKLPSGATTAVEADEHETVAELGHRILATAPAEEGLVAGEGGRDGGGGGGSCRLLFAGRELEGWRRLADYNVAAESELHVLLRRNDPTASLRAQLRGKDSLDDYEVQEKVGGKEFGAPPSPGGGYSLNGVCSVVYRARLRREQRGGAGDGGAPLLALKVMINSAAGSYSHAIAGEFEAECAVVSDPARLPVHPHIVSVLHTFTDSVRDLPGWNFDPTIVHGRTMVLVMRCYPRDLKSALQSARRAGRARFEDARAARIGKHLLSAVAHLKAHGVLHRDIKLDNVLLERPGTADEVALLTDFGGRGDFCHLHTPI
jgi:hypothetical protein